MRRLVLPLACACLAGTGCKPEIGNPISLITGPTILAVRGEPAEAAAGQPVSYELLAVDVDGPIPAVNSVLSDPALWAICIVPKPPTESNAVAKQCLDVATLPGAPGSTLTTFDAPMLDNACSLFGPIAPPVQGDEAPIQPRAPDITGGYYLPVRVSIGIPPNLSRPGMATPDTLVGFALERISCGLANAPAADLTQYNKTYTPNQNPTIAQVTWKQGNGDALPLDPVVPGAFPIAQISLSGGPVVFELSWPDAAAETYPAFDIGARELYTTREAMRAAWYATSGKFEHDTTGRTEYDYGLSVTNRWTMDTQGPVNLWAVLHDSRGGVAFAYYAIEVTP
jgi:hypothetical protein